MTIHTRAELIQWIRKNVIDPVLQNAMEWGRIENLGGFRPLPTSNRPGWIVRMTSNRGKVYYVAVAVNHFGLYWFRLKKVDWSLWAGDRAKDELYRGDDVHEGEDEKISGDLC